MTKKMYGGRFLPVEPISSILEHFADGRKVRTAGRMMTRRDMGKSTFADLRDESGRVQIYGKKDELLDQYEVFTSLSLGDIIGLEGVCFVSKKGERSIKIEKLEVLSSIVRTLPEKCHVLKDIETRYRHRYVDLIVNE